MKAIVATDRHVARLQKNTIPHGKAGFKPSVHAEIDFQPPDLCPNFCVRLHFQPQQHDSHAVKQPVVVDFSVTIRMFKTIYLSGEAGNHARFVMKKMSIILFIQSNLCNLHLLPCSSTAQI